MAEIPKNKCFICGADKIKLINSQLREDDGSLIKVKVCVKCWKETWDQLLKSKEVKIA